MRASSPSRKISSRSANRLLCMLLAGCGCLSGCSILSIPSYRLENYHPNHSPCVDSGHADSCSHHNLEIQQLDDCETTACGESNFAPVFPTIPVPGCIERWKEHRNLPAGPQGLRFHPLPTRPMFSPKPAQLNNFAGMASGVESVTPTYGTIPRGAQWVEPVQASEAVPNASGRSADSETSELKQSPNGPIVRTPRPDNTEELPSPSKK